ncbi:hypothetical protein BDU57DRAFT_514708 [Ampelomyces quisqualis]|uniref:Uncharacterized protein n=1 Tax=Ampelomyces quisqualis TaxID=50730 RepID=A0A6A5QW87_AMPQU|nr:hypothetical protein BDU57DRAFT_514708 [Ampelomyces quisqualis]
MSNKAKTQSLPAKDCIHLEITTSHVAHIAAHIPSTHIAIITIIVVDIGITTIASICHCGS